VEFGNLALDRAQSPQVRQYAQKMISDHSTQAKMLIKVAEQHQITLPNELDAQHQALKQKLSALRGAPFDEAYAKAMASGHDDAVALFESASQAPQLPAQLKEFAAANLRTLKEHRDMADALAH
jgi:putative membrane protein